MRRRLGVLTGTTALVLAATVATAGPAGARNVGGLVPEGTSCIQPGAVALPKQASSHVPCICYSDGRERFRNVGARGAGADACPAGVPEIKIDRNVGG